MSKSLYQEAIADAKELKRVAEQNAKNAIIESVTPRIREFIEEQLINDEIFESADDTAGVLETVAKEVVGDFASNNDNENIALDEGAVLSLIKMLGGEKAVANLESHIVSEISDVFETESQEKISELTNLIKKMNNSESNQINIIDDNQKMENVNMSNSDNSVLYEIDLNELMNEEDGSEAGDDSATHSGEKDYTAKKGSKKKTSGSGRGEKEGDEAYVNEDYEAWLDDLLSEASLRLELGDVEIDPSELAVMLMSDDEEEVDIDIETADDIEDDDEEVEVDVEDEEIDVVDETDMIYEIDEAMLREELAKLRALSEAKELAKLKGINKDMADSWGGKGSGKSGDDFGGGKRGGDALKVTLNKLSEVVKNERRKNRSLNNKLSQYRSAVETLREQLTDLNLFNAKLLYVNKLLQNKDVSATQRRSIIESLDSARSLREVKLLYKSLTESISKPKSSTLSESNIRRTLGASSRTTSSASAKPDAASEVSRWAQLAGLNK